MSGIALTAGSLSTNAGAQETVAPTLAVPPAPAAASTSTAGTDTVSSTPEGTALAAVAVATVGYPLSESDSAEVTRQLGPYPTPIKDLRSFALENSTAPSIGLTPSLRPEQKKSILGIKI